MTTCAAEPNALQRMHDTNSKAHAASRGNAKRRADAGRGRNARIIVIVMRESAGGSSVESEGTLFPAVDLVSPQRRQRCHDRVCGIEPAHYDRRSVRSPPTKNTT